ncbi:MAG: glycine dehydrogenase (aminomethyl-transferring) [Flavobacteriales bacterium]|nr:glycine dehydrogenase (aminomethyl-transferring) [Flavobacteriales bacterium]|tara:strand:+ start:28734 stop:31619 length:2886 start_codon:yes stop_codon:yes gene_type:complete
MLPESDFINRHIGPRKLDTIEMLKQIGKKNIDELINDTIPQNIRLKSELNVGAPMSETRYLEHIQNLGRKNKNYRSYIGLGYYNTILPAVIQRNILENPGWYTAYTPYQAEISQGRLEALFNFQTVITDLTGMEVTNASLLDEATAAAEAMILSYQCRSRDKKNINANKYLVSENCFPQTIDVIKTRAQSIGIDIQIVQNENFIFDESVFGLIVQYPCKFGAVKDFEQLVHMAHKNDCIITFAADLLSLCLLKSPGELDADIVIGSSQRFGIPLGYGGPHAAYFATKEKFKRSIPGRIIGLSFDKEGKKAYRMALQTREQHIRREKATSNICTSQVLLAVMAGMYAVYHGPKKLKKIAETISFYTSVLSESLTKIGYKQKNDVFFDTILIDTGDVSNKNIKVYAEDAKMNFNYISDNLISISIDEKDDLQNISDIINVFLKAKNNNNSDLDKYICQSPKKTIPHNFLRTTKFLEYDVFQSYHSETELMRYIKSLENKDLSLTHSMIPLGSCTMKLNAAAELFSLSSTDFSNIHPFAPLNQARGYQIVFHELEEALCQITGMASVSLQPNSGAQGEYAGLMVIKKYHEFNGDLNRKICLIPSSAHGTNPASAVMAGMTVVIVKCDEEGNIDLIDLKQKVQIHKENLAALMITYPSTHGVFEENILDITKIIHEAGGQVYMDGANMNAQVGLTNPKEIGCDVCHLNLHKTFAIPHGGGGPGMGPIAVAEHLKDFTPKSAIVNYGGKHGISSISASPWGSGLILTISYAYIKLLGSKGLKKCTEIAILNANYLKTLLEQDFDILYKGKNNTVAHEMIIDCRVFKEKNINVSDIAKRLMDYGFHAPTVSFPVPGTMMIEPTESESKFALDNFYNAMSSIKKEIESIKDDENNILKNSPHTQEMITSESWDYNYSREEAVFPLKSVKHNKYWPSVARINEVQGDRNLMCSCASIELYENKKNLIPS